MALVLRLILDCDITLREYFIQSMIHTLLVIAIVLITFPTVYWKHYVTIHFHCEFKFTCLIAVLELWNGRLFWFVYQYQHIDIWYIITYLVITKIISRVSFWEWVKFVIGLTCLVSSIWISKQSKSETVYIQGQTCLVSIDTTSLSLSLPSHTNFIILFNIIIIPSSQYCHRDNAYYHFLSFKIPYYPLSHFHIISILSSAQCYFSHSFKLIRYTTFLIISTWILSDVTRK